MAVHHRLFWGVVIAAIFFYAAVPQPWRDLISPLNLQNHKSKQSPYGRFPRFNDAFHFVPCTNTSVLPDLDDANPEKSWASTFNPNPIHWSWGYRDPFAGRGIYLCGYLDLPMDYTNASDQRIVRLAVTKYQVSGLARTGSPPTKSGQKSARTLVIEPGGPGGSGTSYAWHAAENLTQRLSFGQYDVLGWDPRGVNASLPSVSCFPYDSERDRWSLLGGTYRETASSPDSQLAIADAMNEAVLNACREKYGDFARFVSTAFVARDMEEIRKALREDDLTAYLVSYGTGIGQTYANMFPESVGRIVMDGMEYVRDHRLLGGFGWTALDNSTNAWHDGFLGECLDAGPDQCALAQAKSKEVVSVDSLEKRMTSLISSLLSRPAVGYTALAGPSLITYSSLIDLIYMSMYNAFTWPELAQLLSDLEDGNSTLVAKALESKRWTYNPTHPLPPHPLSEELGILVICADSYDAPQPENLDWWGDLWHNMTTQNWIAGNSRFFDVLPCRQFKNLWEAPAELYRGDLNHTLKHPVLLISETYDPATPLRNGRRLLAEMGRNARMVVHHGYGHSSRDSSNCTDDIARTYLLHGRLPEEQETNCYANEKPYRYKLSSSMLQSISMYSNGALF
ncbi:alpha/beta-hydrolase [Pseudovirgaria hyperparasitica]|uniref:Alpha/beta-hydrolase n=1 Tax=Pseudovirgaria hyperparasitica TaxID=470096 RepID=A0A6A6W137_9PEZI|nr:alpha/beta-hydrolase [Pseudovirgaria hyperparasitica]KAF2755694.1 alpha/beta-hydrolase [Pseudovirgaria hyperparasitica]